MAAETTSSATAMSVQRRADGPVEQQAAADNALPDDGAAARAPLPRRECGGEQCRPKRVLPQRLRVLHDKVHQLDVHALASEWVVSEILLQDILNSLARPGRDPRDDLPAPVFRRGIVKLEDLEPGMQTVGHGAECRRFWRVCRYWAFRQWPGPYQSFG